MLLSTYLHVTALVCVDLSTKFLLNLRKVQVLLDALQNGVAKVATCYPKEKEQISHRIPDGTIALQYHHNETSLKMLVFHEPSHFLRTS